MWKTRGINETQLTIKLSSTILCSQFHTREALSRTYQLFLHARAGVVKQVEELFGVLQLQMLPIARIHAALGVVAKLDLRTHDFIFHCHSERIIVFNFNIVVTFTWSCSETSKAPRPRFAPKGWP